MLITPAWDKLREWISLSANATAGDELRHTERERAMTSSCFMSVGTGE